VPAAPAASCVKVENTRVSHREVGRSHPAFPHAMVLTAYFALSPATNSSCHRRRRIRLIKPGRADFTSAGLAPATGARTTRLCRPRWRRSSARLVIAHRSVEPAPRSPRAPDAAASTASHANVRDDRDTPLFEGTGRHCVWRCFYLATNRKIFRVGTGQTESPHVRSALTRCSGPAGAAAPSPPAHR
jgi:hypothetical protein